MQGMASRFYLLLAYLCTRHCRVGSLVGAARLLEYNAGALRCFQVICMSTKTNSVERCYGVFHFCAMLIVQSFVQSAMEWGRAAAGRGGAGGRVGGRGVVKHCLLSKCCRQDGVAKMSSRSCRRDVVVKVLPSKSYT